MSARAIAAVWLFSLSALAAAETRTPSFQLEGGASRENLDNGYDDWGSVYLDAVWNRAPRKTYYGGLRRTERFGYYDAEVMVGGYYPLGERVTGVIEGSISPTHEVLPKWSLLGQAEIALAGGWGLQFGARHTEYAEVYSDQLVITAEYYFGNYRAAYTFYRSYLEGDDPVNAHRLAFGHYYGRYGERSYFAAAYSTGQEVESQGPNRVQVTDVRSAVLVGRHWFAPAWAISWEVGQHRAIDRYTRNAVRLGVRHEF